MRIPRLTSAIWKYENGAVGSFQHAVALQGTAYSCELEVWADGECEPINMFYQADSHAGYHMRLVDPYNSPSLLVRRPGGEYAGERWYNAILTSAVDDHEERHSYTDDDPFFSEVSSFIDCIEGGPDPHILSSFEDATKSYE